MQEQSLGLGVQLAVTDAHKQLAGAASAAGGSNLAIALRVLPQSRRRDMSIFYAFCREVDDLADEPGLSMEERRLGLLRWRKALSSGGTGRQTEPARAGALREVLDRRAVPTEWAMEVVLGCEMDLEGAKYRTWEELRNYCYRVASAVGLVSARIFGGSGCDVYAEELGIALQLTNILRDAAEDYAVSGRVYLPSEELARFGVVEGSWVDGEPEGWAALMEFQAARALRHYAAARASLPEKERRVMVAAEIMREVYSTLLKRMADDGFRVWERSYRLSRRRKVWLAATVFARTSFVTARQMRRETLRARAALWLPEAVL
jgi:phytoene synthase